MMYKQNKAVLAGMAENEMFNEIADFRLYIKGMYPDSVKALIATKVICDRYLQGRSTLEIIDTIKEPGRALADGVTKIPTLVKLSPYPLQSLSNELDDPEQILVTLGLQT